MTIKEFESLEIGDTVYIVINTGVAGISKYQYVGIFTDHESKEKNHVFLSPYFVSTVCVLYDRESKSRNVKRMFLTPEEAKEYKNFLIKDGQ